MLCDGVVDKIPPSKADGSEKSGLFAFLMGYPPLLKFWRRKNSRNLALFDRQGVEIRPALPA